jgi:hypothetical protein
MRASKERGTKPQASKAFCHQDIESLHTPEVLFARKTIYERLQLSKILCGMVYVYGEALAHLETSEGGSPL